MVDGQCNIEVRAFDDVRGGLRPEITDNQV
jgi:hypothetical protein